MQHGISGDKIGYAIVAVNFIKHEEFLMHLRQDHKTFLASRA